MKHRISLLGLLALFTCTSYHPDQCVSVAEKQQFTLAKTPEEVGFSAERLARIDSFFQHSVDKGFMPQAVTFIARHGKIVHFKAFGWKNLKKKEPVKPDDIFRIASQTKAITTVGLMRLYEEGKFLLDDPISRYIPEFKNPQVLVSLNDTTGAYKTRPAKGEITIRHLLSHTSGIHYGNILYTKDSIPLVNSLKNETIAEVVKKLAKQPLLHDPGESFTYGLNCDVAGYLIEILSGMKLDEYLKTYIFDPLGMKDTYFYLPEDKASRLVTLYEKVNRDSSLRLASSIQNQTYPVAGAKTYLSGGAGLEGTIEDYAKFIQMLLNGGSFNGHQILGRKTIDMMTTNQIGENYIWGGKDKFGLGFQIITEKTMAQMPASLGSYKWGGMYATDYLIDPAEDLICLIYTNVNPFDNDNLHERFRVLVYQALTGE